MPSNGPPAPELDDGFEQTDWQVPYLDDEPEELMLGRIIDTAAFLFGRRTYELSPRTGLMSPTPASRWRPG